MKYAKGRVARWVFDSPALKVERAYFHVQKIVKCLHVYLRSDFCFPFIDHDIKEIRSGLSVKLKPLPDFVPLMIGDAVHNLRSALDHLIINIVRSSGTKPSNYLVFPFAQTREELVGTGRMKELLRSIPDIHDVILNVIKPYENGNNLLWGLNKLDVADKHRLIVPIVHPTSLPGVYAVDENGVERVCDCTFIIDEPGAMRGLTLDGKLYIKSHGKPQVQIQFGRADAFAGKPIVETLVQIGQAVSGTLDVLAAYLFGEGATDHRSAPSRSIE